MTDEDPRRTGTRAGARFKGSVYHDGFSLRRVSIAQNSFAPRLHGHFLEQDGRTFIDVKAHLDPLIGGLTGLWLFGVIFAFFSVLAAAIEGTSSWAMLLFPASMLACAWGLVCVSFQRGLRAAEQDLLEAVDGESLSVTQLDQLTG